MIFVIVCKLPDETTQVVKSYLSEKKANDDMDLLKSLATDKRFRVFPSELDKTVGKRTPASKKEYSDEFEQFWKAYPKKKSKGDAWKVWQIVKPPIADVLIALAWQVKSLQWTQEGGKWIPHPATYLNRAGWHDEPSDAAVMSNGKLWYMTSSGIEEEAKRLGIVQESREHFQYFKVRVHKAAGITSEMVRKAESDFRAAA